MTATIGELCDERRADEFGRAFAGSQLQIQIYVNRRAAELDEAIRRAIPELPDVPFEWRSPLTKDCFREYRDREFLRAAGLQWFAPQLRDWWPRRGPQWDGLAVVGGLSNGVILVEAKSYPAEMRGSGTQAGGDRRDKIVRALAETQAWVGASATQAWTGGLYQLANRLAHLYFLEKAGVKAWLVQICFLNDPHSPTTMSGWKGHISAAFEELGIKRHVPRCADVYLEAHQRRELVGDSDEAGAERQPSGDSEDRVVQNHQELPSRK